MATKKRQAVDRATGRRVVSWYITWQKRQLSETEKAVRGDVVVQEQDGRSWAASPAEFDDQFKVLEK